MKLLIQEPLNWSTTYPPDYSDDELDELQEFYQSIVDTMRDLGVSTVSSVDGSSAYFSIHAQKITLGEIQMNRFLHVVLSHLFDFQLRYCGFGGIGCELTLALDDVVPRSVI